MAWRTTVSVHARTSTLLPNALPFAQAGGMLEPILTHEKAGEFQQLMREECGVELTLEEASTRASQLIALYRMLMGPIPEDPGFEHPHT
jgi:hypothetical protein